MLRFTTISGSIYELDDDAKRIRRVIGITPQTRVGPDGQWKEFLSTTQPMPGQSVIIIWAIEMVDGQPIAKTTTTSIVATVGDQAVA